MPAYVINDMVVTDPELFERYKQLSPPTVAQYGGRFLARGGQIENLEGDWKRPPYWATVGGESCL